MRHYLDLSTAQLRILFIAIPDHTKDWEHMKPVVEKMQRLLAIARD